MAGVATKALGALADAAATWQRIEANRALLYPSLSVMDRETFVVASLVQQPERLATVPLVWVSSEMVDLLEHAAATLPVHPFNQASLPWRDAFVVLDRPIVSDDVPISAVTWSPITRWPLPKYWRAERASDHLIAALVRREQALSTVLWSKCRSGEPITSTTQEDLPDHDWDHYARVIAALWLLIQQRVAVRRTIQPDRPDARRWGRDHDEPVPTVTVVELRRPVHSQPGTETPAVDVDWSHRWIVDGHWRNQYHPSSGEHVPTWIAPYVKGPDDKPLVVKRKVNAWVR